MEEDKIFSIVIPVYNGEKTIKRTLISLLNNKDWIKDIVIVNDYSTDSTMEIVESFKQDLPIITFDNNGPHNPGMARKIGLQNTTGEWVIFVDADDCLTPWGLRYAKKQIDLNPDCLCLCPYLIYYEIGKFNAEHIRQVNYSCIGNIYNRKYLISNNLFPSEILKLSEDEYYGKKILINIKYKDNNLFAIQYYDYPIYEVHHDEIKGSFASSNWLDYAIKYHLESQKLLTEDFLDFPKMKKGLIDLYIQNFIFCYFIYICLIEDEAFIFNRAEQLDHFRDALDFFINKLSGSKHLLIKYFNKKPNDVENALQGAIASTGIYIENPNTFKDFINSL